MAAPEQDRALSELVHRAAHELQTPLSSVTMLLSAVRAAPELDPALGRNVRDALDATQRAVGLVRALVEFADAGLALRPLEDVDCDALVRALVAPRAGELDADVASLPVVRGDRPGLRSVFAALIDNACRYAGAARPALTVACARCGEEWRFELADRGIGIPAGQRERVLEPLVRLHGWDEIPGHGLGLAICRRVVERCGGRIGVDCRDGGGTVVWFTLPA